MPIERLLSRLALRALSFLAWATASTAFAARPASPPTPGGTLTYATDIEPPALLSLFDTNTPSGLVLHRR